MRRWRFISGVILLEQSLMRCRAGQYLWNYPPGPATAPVYTSALTFTGRIPAFVFPASPGTETRSQIQTAGD